MLTSKSNIRTVHYATCGWPQHNYNLYNITDSKDTDHTSFNKNSDRRLN